MIRDGVEIDSLDALRAQAGSAPGLLHPIGLREVVSGRFALRGLASCLDRIGVPAGAVVTVLTDPVRKRYREAGADAADAAVDVMDVVHEVLSARYRPTAAVLGTSGSTLHADERTVDDAVALVAAQAPRALVTVGSGTLADIGKVAAQRLDLVHVVVQTAASVNGFADDQSVLLRSGTKRTTPSRWPDAVVIDPDVVAYAPLAMTGSGLGDQLSMFTAAADWYLAAAAGYDPSYSPEVVAILREGSARTLAAATGLADGVPDAVLALAASLTRGGLAMGIAGRTSPSSGTEHTISHLLEMHAGAHGIAAASHGSQVGVGSVVAAALWVRVRARLAAGGVTVHPLRESAMRRRVTTAFGPLDESGGVARECWSAYQRKLEWINGNLAQLQRLCDGWAEHDPVVGALLAPPATIAATLRSAAAPTRFAELDPAPDPTTVVWAVASGHLLRDRFTVADLAEVTGLWTPDDVAAVLAATQDRAVVA